MDKLSESSFGNIKVLELFCGLGGWSKPWIEKGYDVTGIDFKDFSKDYPARFIQADLMDWEPDQHYDIILASPPCNEFSIIKKNRTREQVEKSKGGGRIIGSKKPQLKATCKNSAERALIPYPLARAVMERILDR